MPIKYPQEEQPDNYDVPDQNEPEKVDSLHGLPEVFANPKLENTTLVYSVPFIGEWKNGNLLRTIEGFLVQKTKPGEAFEVELIANIGKKIREVDLDDIREGLREKIRETANELGIVRKKLAETKADHYNFLGLKNQATFLENDSQNLEKVLSALSEAKEAGEFIKKIIKVQAIGRKIKRKPKDIKLKAELDNILTAEQRALKRNVLKKAAERADTISFTLIDASEKTLKKTSYRFGNFIDALRTLGADVAAARFEGNKNLVLSLFDADTVPENTSSVRDIQKLFDSDPRLTYAFAGLTNFPAGISKQFVSSSPKEKIDRTICYNERYYHGSPQIFFRLGAYKKLKEIARYPGCGYFHDEDRDTAIRLIYHFGKLQDGILFERSLDGVLPPGVLTADRLDGFCDSVGRGKVKYKENQFENSIASILDLKEKTMEHIRSLPVKEREQINAFYENAKKNYRKKERIQLRMNRLVAGLFLDCIDNGLISYTPEAGIRLKEEEIYKMRGGTALLHFINGNAFLIEEIIKSPQDQELIGYYVGKNAKFPEGLNKLSPFQTAIREYLGELPPEETKTFVAMKTKETEKVGDTYGWKVADLRPLDSKESILHEIIIEMQTLGTTYRTFFETKEFLDSVHFEELPENSEQQRQLNLAQIEKKMRAKEWPEDPEQQKVPYDFEDQSKRLQVIKEKFPDLQITEKPLVPSWYSTISPRLFPIFRLFREIIGGGL